MNPRTLPATIGAQLFRASGRVARTVQHVRTLPADVLENESTYLVLVDTPGAEPSGLDIRYLDGRLQIAVERTRHHDRNATGTVLGRAMELSTDVTLPEDAVVDPESATARLSSVGTVKIELPKEAGPDDTESAVGEEIPIDD